MQIEQTWGEGDGGANRESSTEAYALPYVKLFTSANFLYDSGNSSQGAVTT